MNKSELVASVAEKSGLTKKDAEKAVNAVFDSITATLVSGEKVQLVGFGTFEVRERKERQGQTHRPSSLSLFLQPRFLHLRQAKVLRMLLSVNNQYRNFAHGPKL